MNDSKKAWIIFDGSLFEGYIKDLRYGHSITNIEGLAVEVTINHAKTYDINTPEGKQKYREWLLFSLAEIGV